MCLSAHPIHFSPSFKGKNTCGGVHSVACVFGGGRKKTPNLASPQPQQINPLSVPPLHINRILPLILSPITSTFFCLPSFFLHTFSSYHCHQRDTPISFFNLVFPSPFIPLYTFFLSPSSKRPSPPFFLSFFSLFPFTSTTAFFLPFRRLTSALRCRTGRRETLTST